MRRNKNPTKKHDNPFSMVDGCEKNEPFIMITSKMMRSETYQNLSNDAKYVLSVCKYCRRYHTREPIQDNILYFYFNRSLQKQFKLNNPNKVHKALEELVKNGFITVIECNKYRKIKNIYAFSGQWQIKDQGKEIILSDAAKTFLKDYKK